MSLLMCNMTALAVVVFYCVWKLRCQVAERRRRVLRERVAYMLWVMALRRDGGPRATTTAGPA